MSKSLHKPSTAAPGSRMDRIGPISFGATPTRITAEGYRHYEGTATIGDVILPYMAPSPHLEFRPAEEVLSDEAVLSMAGVPVGNDHPADLLRHDDPEGLRQFYEGAVLRAWREEGEFPRLRVAVVVYTKPLQELIEAGKVELSPGYNCDPDPTPGEHNGQEFHVVQRRVRYNHLAVVDRARTRTPTGEVARLDKDDAMNEETETTDKRNDAVVLSEQDMALVAQMSPEGQEMIQKALACMEAQGAEEAAMAAGATPEQAEIVEKQAAGAAGGAGPMDPKEMMDALKALKADMAAMKDQMGKRDDAAPADASADRQGQITDAAKIMAEVDKKFAAERSRTLSHLKDLEIVRRDSAETIGDGVSETDVVKAMITEIVKETPGSKGLAERALKQGRMDDLRDLYSVAIEARRAKRVDAQEDAFSFAVPGNGVRLVPAVDADLSKIPDNIA